MAFSKKDSLKDLQRIPVVGSRIADDLWNVGFCSVAEFNTKTPKKCSEIFVLNHL